MKNLIVIILIAPLIVFAQNSQRFIKKGLLSGKGTLAAGQMTAFKVTNMYVSGNLEYYVEDNISFRGGLWFFLGTSGAPDKFSKNSSLFTGFYYHFTTKNNIDPYIGFEPGISWTQLKEPDNLTSESNPYKLSTYPQTISPMASLTTGINYYATNWAHLFMEVKYVYGIHLSDIPSASLSELKIAFGFGFNMWTIKKKTKPD